MGNPANGNVVIDVNKLARSFASLREYFLEKFGETGCSCRVGKGRKYSREVSLCLEGVDLLKPFNGLFNRFTIVCAF